MRAKALVLEKVRELSLRDIDIPLEVGPDDVKIKIDTVGVCGSDVHYYTHGRIGNFINEEQWGRPTDVPWAVLFPDVDSNPRHPSQLYEAACEGLLLFLVLAVAERSGARRYPGVLSGLFLAGYAVARMSGVCPSSKQTWAPAFRASGSSGAAWGPRTTTVSSHPPSRSASHSRCRALQCCARKDSGERQASRHSCFKGVNWYAPAAFVSPETLCTFTIAVPFAAWSIENFSTSGFLKCFVFVQRYVPFNPTCIGKYAVSAGGAFAVWFVDWRTAVVTGALLPPACWKTTFTGPTP